MRVDEGLLRKVRERWQPLPWSGQWEEVELEEDLRPVMPAHVEGKVSREEGGYRFQGTLSARLTAPCHRCLRPVEFALDVPVEALFTTSLVDETSEETMPEGDIPRYPLESERVLDLSPALHDALVLALPMKVLCQEDCPGLCPHCGALLEEGPCGCSEGPADPRMAPLLALLNGNERSQK
ncbi:hypothetical protein GJ688_01525 [Heliobacillus mobilis]|uniref:DUF177 domain-containing protein n=1 Tax=Heliobacterium mobile TaxID=28064 RepID=A0A6I3SF91_HELMO|nr:DUF177 domain-containing protein [Heliobacterium mobile]MTV47660.1 hypothetical protein [Heliobacterium mobile]